VGLYLLAPVSAIRASLLNDPWQSGKCFSSVYEQALYWVKTAASQILCYLRSELWQCNNRSCSHRHHCCTGCLHACTPETGKDRSFVRLDYKIGRQGLLRYIRVFLTRCSLQQIEEERHCWAYLFRLIYKMYKIHVRFENITFLWIKMVVHFKQFANTTVCGFADI